MYYTPSVSHEQFLSLRGYRMARMMRERIDFQFSSFYPEKNLGAKLRVAQRAHK
jgi:hypothetical protein